MFDSAQIFLSAFKLCKPFRWASETKDYVSKGFHNPLSLLSIAQNRMPTGIFVQSRTQVYWLKRVFHETFLVCCWLFHFLIKFIILYVFLGVRLMILSDQIPPMLIKTNSAILSWYIELLHGCKMVFSTKLNDKLYKRCHSNSFFEQWRWDSKDCGSLCWHNPCFRRLIGMVCESEFEGHLLYNLSHKLPSNHSYITIPPSTCRTCPVM